MGGKRITIEQVREAFENEGYTLLSEEYINNSQKLEFICDKGHKHCIRWSDFNNGIRCAFCAGQGKPTIEQVREAFESIGWELLSTEYINNKQKLDFVCDKGHQHSIRWSNFNNGIRCASCSGKAKFKIEQVREAFENIGWELLSTEYSNCDQKLDFICDRGHQHSISWYTFNNGVRCASCSGNKKLTIQQVRKAFENEGYTLLSSEYSNCDQKLEFICDKGHSHSISWNSFNNGNRCGICFQDSIKGYDYASLKVKGIIYDRIKSKIKFQMEEKELIKHCEKIYKSVEHVYKSRKNGQHVDHIIPLSYFDFSSIKAIEFCWSDKNLRCVDAIQNVQRHNNFTILDAVHLKNIDFWEIHSLLTGKAIVELLKYKDYFKSY